MSEFAELTSDTSVFGLATVPSKIAGYNVAQEREATVWKRLFATLQVAVPAIGAIGDDIGRLARSTSAAPRSGLVNVVEESSDNLGRWFARYGDGAETFSARLLNGTDELGIAWTESIRQIAPNIAEIQGTIGRNIPRISGTASDGLEAAIRAGRFNSDLYARQLSRHLGGQWNVEAVRRSGVSNEIWDIIATRIGG
ncbi:MAG: hypothetical protein NXI32_02265 [bacterium]|nr:hypothetical protein [bacterium]